MLARLGQAEYYKAWWETLCWRSVSLKSFALASTPPLKFGSCGHTRPAPLDLRVDAAAADVHQLGLTGNRQLVFGVEHFLALSMPVFLGALFL